MRARTAAVAIALCVLAVAAEARSVRAFPVRHRPVRELALQVESLLSPDGIMTFQRQFNLLTVQDTPEVIERVAKLLEELDVPPPIYTVRIQVLLGTSIPASPPSVGQPVDGVNAELSKVFHFASYQEVETVRITATEGTAVEANAGGPYHLRFVLKTVPGDPNRVQLSQLEVSRRQQVISGAPDMLRTVLRTSVSLEIGQTAILGMARSESASEGLVLVLWAEREPAR